MFHPFHVVKHEGGCPCAKSANTLDVGHDPWSCAGHPPQKMGDMLLLMVRYYRDH